MIKFLAIRFGTLGLLTFLVLGLDKFQEVEVWHVAVLMFYAINIPLLWWMFDGLLGVRCGRRRDSSFGEVVGGDLWVRNPDLRRPVKFIHWRLCCCKVKK